MLKTNAAVFLQEKTEEKSHLWSQISQMYCRIKTAVKRLVNALGPVVIRTEVGQSPLYISDDNFTQKREFWLSQDDL